MISKKVFTLLYVEDESKTVQIKVFLDFSDLVDYKRFFNESIKDAELQQVDKDGYVWFCESLID